MLSGGMLALGIGAKPTALPLVVGMIGGVVVLGGWRSAWARRWAVAAAGAVVVAGVAWALLVLLPQRDAFAITLRILAEQTFPAGVGELLYRVLSYPLSNDRALLYTLPLLLGSASGIVLAWSAWHSLPPGTRRLVALSVGWLVAGVGVLMVVPYRPNRYFLPQLPALAILTAVAVHLWFGHGVGERAGRLASRLRRVDRRIALTAVFGALVLPGLALHGVMMLNGTRDLAPLQAAVAAELPPGAVVQGAYAPLLAFESGAVAIVSRPESGVNAGDLYTTRGVRWLVVEDGIEPAWADAHRAAWEARRTALCQRWGRSELCLVELP